MYTPYSRCKRSRRRKASRRVIHEVNQALVENDIDTVRNVSEDDPDKENDFPRKSSRKQVKTKMARRTKRINDTDDEEEAEYEFLDL